jgi:hypothetical protein
MVNKNSFVFAAGVALVFAFASLMLAVRLINIQNHPDQFVAGLSDDKRDAVFVVLSAEVF